jgi:UDP-N-acetylglucosamine--N-acetylmuramyl-(pentapeptide) pyrophosphoryl-undecaprenol N-acetylglucosamine transferase
MEMRMMAPMLEPERHADGIWITHPAPQSSSMLDGEQTFLIEHIYPRDWRSVLVHAPGLLKILRDNNVDRVYSTGAALALAVLPASRVVGARPRYIESLARVGRPSVTGQVLRLIPWVPVFTQYAHNASRRWKYEFSLLDAFTTVEAPATRPTRIFVSLGTQQDYFFRRLVDRLLQVLPPDAEVVWQIGAGDVPGLPISTVGVIPHEEFRATVRWADVVIAHAGVGTLLTCLDGGKVPVVVPRRAAFDEHVDDHQVQIASVAAAQGLAIACEADEVTMEHLHRAAARRAVRVTPDPGSLA